MYRALLLGFILVYLTACTAEEPAAVQPTVPAAPDIIVLSKEKKDERYSNWVRHVDADFKFVSLYHTSPDSIDYYLERAVGVIITGGEDVAPDRYGKGDQVERCGDINFRRDTLEFKMVNYALNNNIPLMGICRGEQLMNVATGGTLIIDIPTDWHDTTVKHSNGEDYIDHWVKLDTASELYKICQADSCLVKTYHHQAVDQVSTQFNVAAHTNDGLIEAIELKKLTKHPFAMGVQWHPEKMDYSQPYSGPIAVAFVAAVRLH
jgi:putative glutamine amidotransferase